MQTFTVPIKIPSLNEYTSACRTNAYAGAKMKKDVQTTVALFAKRLKPVTKPVTVAFEWTEKNKRRDLDNVSYGKKFILDALVEAGILPDDSPRWVRGFTDTFTLGNDYKVTITIKEEEQ